MSKLFVAVFCVVVGAAGFFFAEGIAGLTSAALAQTGHGGNNDCEGYCNPRDGSPGDCCAQIIFGLCDCLFGELDQGDCVYGPC